MGCLTSTQKESTHINIDTLTQQDNPQPIKHKLLLLGAGECGTSTLLRQLRRLYGSNFSESELMPIKQHLTQNVIEAMRTLAIYSEILYDEGHDTKVNEDNRDIRKRVACMSDQQKFTREHCEDLTALWNDYHIKNVLEFAHTFHLLDTCQYLFHQMHNYWRDEYIPTFEDLIHSRQRSTGINKIKIKLSHSSVNEIYEIFDAPGTKSERKKWIHFFHNVSKTIIFVIALSGYNEILWEDSTSNKMKEAIALFRNILNLNVFKGCNFIIFLNKYDLFCEKVGKYSVKKYFGDYTGSDDNEVEIINFFKQKIRSQWKEIPSRRKPVIRFYIGSATNSLCCKEIFDINIIGNYKLSVQHIKYVVRMWYEYNTCKQLNSFVIHSMTYIILSYFGKRIQYQ